MDLLSEEVLFSDCRRASADNETEMRRPTTILLAAMLVEGAFGAKILALMTIASPSHHLWNTKYLEALVDRGHHVTYFGVDKYENPPKNLSHIFVDGVYDLLHKNLDLMSMTDTSIYENILLLREFVDLQTEAIFKSDALKRLVRLIEKEKFDLVVYDFTCGPYLLGAVDASGRPPVVGITAFSVPSWTLEILGNPMAYASKPYFYAPYSDDMTYFQRANNYFLHLFSFAVGWLQMRNHNELSKKYFGSDVRSLEQILEDINIIMVNWNRGTDDAFPMVPGLIPVGGLHVLPPKPLDQGLKNFLDEAKAGAIYFSLGTNIQSAMIKEKVDILLKAFEELAPVRVLWKLDPDALPRKAKNVKVQKWMPQNDVLAHPNVRVFFTHSGLLSTQEAVYHGKPVVGMPFFIDQFSNLQKAIRKGFGEGLSYNSLEVDEIVSTIQKVLNEPRYSENARKASVLFRDEMENPLERAIYWTEYGIRHEGAPHLRYSARNLSWYQTHMLDVIMLVVCSIFVVSFSGYKLSRAIISRICPGAVSKQKRN